MDSETSINLTTSVLSDVRGFLNIESEMGNVFDREVVPHVIASIGILSQNGVTKAQFVNNDTTWGDVIEAKMASNDNVKTLLPLYVMLNTKILFDPPPPSSVQYYKEHVQDILWRLRLEHDMLNTQ